MKETGDEKVFGERKINRSVCMYVCVCVCDVSEIIVSFPQMNSLTANANERCRWTPDNERRTTPFKLRCVCMCV